VVASPIEVHADVEDAAVADDARAAPDPSVDCETMRALSAFGRSLTAIPSRCP
jgi:hypothetical protein